jgi:uncharacterized repeat protein (TIGR01451 family)
MPALVLALLLLATLPRGAQPTSAAPLLAVTGTPTEPPTPTNRPTATQGPQPTPTAAPTNTPKPHNPSSGSADPAITKSASPSQARIGDEVTFTIRVTNEGDATARDVFVNDPIPDYLDILDVSASRGDVAINGKTVVVTIGDLAPGEVVTIRIRTRVNERAQPPGGRNVATVATTSPGDDPSNNLSEVTFSIVAEPTATLPAATPTQAPSPTPVQPAKLPPTGGDDSAAAVRVVAALGLLAIGASMLLRRRARR